MMTAIIVDDESSSCEILAFLLDQYCPNIIVQAIWYSGMAAIHSIRDCKSQLLFLDIEMPCMNGFELLEKIPEINFDIICTSSYDQYAIKAIHFSALNYLLKPIDREELQRAVQKAEQRNQHPLPQQIELLFQKWRQPTKLINKIAIPTMEGFKMICTESIISCSSDSNYTTVHLKNKQKITASRTLKEVEEMLEDHPFARVHHSFLVNLNEIEQYNKGEGGYLVMSDGSTVDVSRSKKQLLLKKLLHGRQ